MKVTKAVITAAGRGTRFLPTVKAYPKELISILNKPQIQYIVEEVIGAGITEICIVHLHGNPQIKQYFTRHNDLEEYLQKNDKLHLLDSLEKIWSKVNFRFIPQPRHLPYGNSSPILAAKNFIGKDPFVYLFGDDLTIEKNPGDLLRKMITQFETTDINSIFAVQPVAHPEIVKYGCIDYKDSPSVPNQINRVIEKPTLEEAPSDMANGGRAIVSNEIVSILSQKTLGKNNELWFVDALNVLAKRGVVVAQNYLEANSRWYTTGDPHNWLIANLAMAANQGMQITLP